MPTALPCPRSGLRYLSDLAATERHRCHSENGKILREACALLAPAMAHRPPSNRAIRLSRWDIISRERCLPARHGFAASPRAPRHVLGARRGATPGLCAARKLRLENSPANRALRLPRLYVEPDKVRESSAPKPPASSRPTISSGNSSCCVCLP